MVCVPHNTLYFPLCQSFGHLRGDFFDATERKKKRKKKRKGGKMSVRLRMVPNWQGCKTGFKVGYMKTST